LEFLVGLIVGSWMLIDCGAMHEMISVGGSEPKDGRQLVSRMRGGDIGIR